MTTALFAGWRRLQQRERWPMHFKFLAMLPHELQSVVEQIEDAIGREVEVGRSAADTVALSQGKSWPTLDCWIQEGRIHAKIGIPESTELTPAGLAHELLHAYRNLVLEVPRLVRADGRIDRIQMMTENDLEHREIVPIERQYFDRSEYWEEVYGDAIAQLDGDRLRAETQNSQIDLMATRHGLLMRWLILDRIVPGSPLLNRLHGLLVRSGLLSEAVKLVARVARNGDGKVAAATAIIRYANLPSEMFRLECYRPRQGGIDQRMLPAF